MRFKIVVVGLIMVLGFSGCIGEKRPSYAMKKEFRIVSKEGKPCFYVESFNGIDNFVIDTFAIHTTSVYPSLEEEDMWSEHIDTTEKPQFKLSYLAGEKNCIKYGARNAFLPSKAKKLNTDVVYTIFMSGSVNGEKVELGTRDWSSSPIDNNWIEVKGNFLISKNTNTNKFDIVELKQNEVSDWISKHKINLQRNK
jgi:hypothetical protein